jgi:hypothetical protein
VPGLRKNFHNPDYVACLRQTFALHRLHLVDKRDTDEAEMLRTDFDRHWERLLPEERRRLGEFSEDLYLLADYK